MTPEQYRLHGAAERAGKALDDCIAVFVGLARIGHYPEALMGVGWEFAADARDELQAAVSAVIPLDSEPDLPPTFGDMGRLSNG
jgi:hypothetical protein